MRTNRLATLALCLALAFPLLAQQRSGSARVEVTLVEVPVNVVSPAGEPVPGLSKESFELSVDGRKREISFFDVVEIGRPAPERSVQPDHPAARRSFLLLFDFTNSTPHAIGRAAEAVDTFVDEGMNDRDLGAVATWSNERGFRLLTAFTTDRSLLRGAIRTLGNPKFFRTTDPLLLVMDPALAQKPSSSTRGDFDSDYLEMVTDTNRNIERANDAYRRGRIEQQLQSFGSIARLLDRIPGRKQVVLLSEGFEASLLHGQEDISREATLEQNEASTRGEIWKIDNDQRFGSTRTASQLNAMSELFRRSDVVLHAMDIQGIRTQVSAREGKRENSNESLFLMADGTGGQVFKNSNDISASFDAMLRQQEVTYILGFQTNGENDPSKFHEIEVKVNEAPRGTRVIHRPGYYESGAEASGIERALSAVTILMNDIPLNDVAIEQMAVPFGVIGGNPVVPVIAEIDGTDVLDGVAGDTVNAELFVYAFDGEGSVQDYLYQKIGLDLTKVRESVAATGLKFYGSLELPPGSYAVKSLFRVAESGRDGFDRVDVLVPDFSVPAISPPLALQAEQGWIMLKAAPRRPADDAYPFAIGSESFVPQPVAHYQDGEANRLALFAWNLPADALQIGARVTGGDGSAHPAAIEILGRTPGSEMKLSKLLLQFTTSDLQPGSYALELDVKDSGGKLNQTVSMPFLVR